MRKLIVFLTILSLVFMSVAPSVFAVAYPNVGPTTNFDGNVGVPSGSAYYINEALLDLEDIGTAGLIKEAMLNADVPAVGDILTYTEDGTDFLWKIPSELITAGTLIAWTNSTLNVTIPADHITYDMMQDTSATDKILGRSTAEAGTIEEIPCTAFARSILDDADEATFKATVNLETGTDVLAQQDIGITDDNLVEVDDADNGGVAATDYARFTANGLEGREPSEVRTDLGLVIGTNVAASGANTDITSLTNTNLSVGRSATNYIAWDVDNTLKIEINDVLHSIVGIDTGAGDHDTLVTQGYVDDAAGAMKNYVEHFMDVLAASATHCHAAEAGNVGATPKDVEGCINPDVPRNVSITTVGTPEACNVIVHGTLADGTTAATDTIAVVNNGIGYGVKAFATLTKYVIPAEVSDAMTIALGISDKIGLSNSISAEADIYKKIVDAVDESHEISTKGNTDNNTLDCATIVANEDITVWYHN